ncbi:hypothetical protein BD769DRAFT_1394800 [Suillus cothurnatus]|nr:hypothetical protein BD769DRAFT_1394800 [Suillus cothurnatus]
MTVIRILRTILGAISPEAVESTQPEESKPLPSCYHRSLAGLGIPGRNCLSRPSLEGRLNVRTVNARDCQTIWKPARRSGASVMVHDFEVNNAIENIYLHLLDYHPLAATRLAYPTLSHGPQYLPQRVSYSNRDRCNYRDHKETVRRTEAIVGALASDVSDITEKVLAHGATLDATYQLAQDGMTSSEHIRTLVHDMSGAVNRIDGDVSLMKLEFEEMKVTLKEIRDAMTLGHKLLEVQENAHHCLNEVVDVLHRLPTYMDVRDEHEILKYKPSNRYIHAVVNGDTKIIRVCRFDPNRILATTFFRRCMKSQFDEWRLSKDRRLKAITCEREYNSAEFCSEIPIANGQTTVLQLMDVSSGPHSIFETTFRQRFSLPIDTTCDRIHTHDSGEVTPSIASDAVLTPKVHQCTPPTTKGSTVMTRSDDLSHGEDRMTYVTSCANSAEDTSHVDDVLSNNAPLSTEYAVERSVYLKRFVRRTSTLTYGWFETTGPQPIDTPPNFSSFDDIQLGDLFLHRTDQKVVCWIREYSPSGAVWKMILPGDNGTHNEDFSCRILALHSDGNPTWVLPKTCIIIMSHEGHHSDGNGMLQSIFIVDITDVHLSMEKTQVANNEKFDSIQTDVSKIKGSLKQTHKIAEGTSSRLMDLEDVVASNQAKTGRYAFIMCIVNFMTLKMRWSVEHHKAILQSGKVLYQKLSEEVADTRAEIGQIVDDILQNISTFHQSTTNDLAALQDSNFNRRGLRTPHVHADNITSHWHAADDETAVIKVDTDISSQTSPFTTEPVTTAVISLRACMDLFGHIFDSISQVACCDTSLRLVHTMLGVIILAKIFRNVVHLGFMKGPNTD